MYFLFFLLFHPYDGLKRIRRVVIFFFAFVIADIYNNILKTYGRIQTRLVSLDVLTTQYEVEKKKLTFTNNNNKTTYVEYAPSVV